MNYRAGALAFVPLAVLTSGCAESVDGGVPSSVLEACLKVPTAQERVFRNAEDWQRFYAEHTEGGAAPAVDFGRSLLAAHFDGAGSACVGFTLDRVEVRDGEVTIDATRHTSQDPCITVVAYPQLLVVVDRRDTPVTFRIRDVVGPPPPGHTPCV
jgi:hypothetical protein